MALLEKWRFPKLYAEVAMYHHDVQRMNRVSRELLVVHLADLLVRAMGYGQAPSGQESLADSIAARHLQVDAAGLEEVEKQVRGRVESIDFRGS